MVETGEECIRACAPEDIGKIVGIVLQSCGKTHSRRRRQPPVVCSQKLVLRGQRDIAEAIGGEIFDPLEPEALDPGKPRPEDLLHILRRESPRVRARQR